MCLSGRLHRLGTPNSERREAFVVSEGRDAKLPYRGSNSGTPSSMETIYHNAQMRSNCGDIGVLFGFSRCRDETSGGEPLPRCVGYLFRPSDLGA